MAFYDIVAVCFLLFWFLLSAIYHTQGKFSRMFVFCYQIWLAANKAKGLEISGNFARRNKAVIMELTLTNKAMQSMTGFAIQFNKNRSGLCVW